MSSTGLLPSFHEVAGEIWDVLTRCPYDQLLDQVGGVLPSASLLLKIKCVPCSSQEALEVRKPQFISRSQERLKKLEHMVQQRKAQQKESLGQKQSLLPVRANKKQFTVPHPLSGK